MTLRKYCIDVAEIKIYYVVKAGAALTFIDIPKLRYRIICQSVKLFARTFFIAELGIHRIRHGHLERPKNRAPRGVIVILNKRRDSVRSTLYQGCIS